MLSAGAPEADGSLLWLIRGDEVTGCLEGDACVEAEPVAPDPVARTGVRPIWSYGGNSCRAASGAAALVNRWYAEEDDGSRERGCESEMKARNEHDTDRSRSVTDDSASGPKISVGDSERIDSRAKTVSSCGTNHVLRSTGLTKMGVASVIYLEIESTGQYMYGACACAPDSML